MAYIVRAYVQPAGSLAKLMQSSHAQVLWLWPLGWGMNQNSVRDVQSLRGFEDDTSSASIVDPASQQGLQEWSASLPVDYCWRVDGLNREPGRVQVVVDGLLGWTSYTFTAWV